MSIVKCKSKRLLGTKFSFPDCDLLVINGYFPCDPRTDNFDETELLETLEDVKSIVENAECQNVVFSGDLNSHFERNNKFTKIIETIIAEIPLKILWNESYCNDKIQEVPHTYAFLTENEGHFSRIDHFLVTERLVGLVNEAGVLNLSENLSNHSIYQHQILCNFFLVNSYLG